MFFFGGGVWKETSDSKTPQTLPKPPDDTSYKILPYLSSAAAIAQSV